MNKLAPARNLLYVAPFALAGLASTGSAQTATTLDFDVSDVQTKAMTILGVGVTVALGFVVYKVGKRASNKI